MAIKKTENKVETKVNTQVETVTLPFTKEKTQEVRETKSIDFCWAVRDERVKIPVKRESDAGYDIYAFFEEDYIIINPKQSRIINTGLYSALPENYFLEFKERSSTAKYNMGIRAGVIEGTYRGELLVCISNHNNVPLAIAKDTITEKEIKQQVAPTTIIYPYEKAITQGILRKIEPAQFRTIPLEELKKMTTIRGEGGFGSTGK
ncbi:MAG TPA: dUTP pyrophosphatase [bacterium]|nr:dUTP pyrophosphatase [bacterium]